MTDATLPLEAELYLRDLEREAAVLPPLERERLQAQIREHLADALDEEADVASVLRRLGSARELVGAAAPAAAPPTVGDAAQLVPDARAVGSSAASAHAPLLIAGLVCTLLGCLALLWGGLMLALTGNPRSMLFPAAAVVLLAPGIAMLLHVRRSRRRDRR
ncbi:HAAS signaling domain-containing protein [Agrococcus beijingensis]|uniref:HAAS signaling domain-containing protein n=1 Tax=Agrococcus beijingensis TaxID=3068634 RepID=UPI0027425962|nr:hypothetical protein [Agrococcus sp. REN33]